MRTGLYNICLCLLVLSVSCSNSAAQTKAKSKYIGEYDYNYSFLHTNDTISGMLFFTADSFALIYQITNDSDYRFPLYQGVWTLNSESKEVELQFSNNTSTKAGRFDDTTYEFAMFLLDNRSFSRKR